LKEDRVLKSEDSEDWTQESSEVGRTSEEDASKAEVSEVLKTSEEVLNFYLWIFNLMCQVVIHLFYIFNVTLAFLF